MEGGDAAASPLPICDIRLQQHHRRAVRRAVLHRPPPITDGRDRVLCTAIESRLGSLRALESPSDFLAHIARMSGNNSVSVQLDFALTHYLVGNVDAAHRILRSLEASPNTVPQRRVIVRQALDRQAANPASLRALIDHWRDENITTFRLGASLQRPSHLRVVKSD